MRLDNRVLVILLICGIFASMSTISIYMDLVAPEIPTLPNSQSTTGTLTITVAAVEDQPADSAEEIRSGNGETG